MVPGHVFVYEKTATGVNSWKDGKDWTEHSISGKLVRWVPRSGSVGKQTYTHEEEGYVHHLVAYHDLGEMGSGKAKQYQVSEAVV